MLLFHRMIFLFLVILSVVEGTAVFQAVKQDDLGFFRASFAANWVDQAVPASGEDAVIDTSRVCDDTFSPAVFWDLPYTLGDVLVSANLGLCPTVVLVSDAINTRRLAVQSRDDASGGVGGEGGEGGEGGGGRPLEEIPLERTKKLFLPCTECVAFDFSLLEFDQASSLAEFSVSAMKVSETWLAIGGQLTYLGVSLTLIPMGRASEFPNITFDNQFSDAGVLSANGLLFSSEDLSLSVRFFQSSEANVTMEVTSRGSIFGESVGVLSFSSRVSPPPREPGVAILYLMHSSSRISGASCSFDSRAFLMGFGTVACGDTKFFGVAIPGHPEVACQRCLPGIFGLQLNATYGNLSFAGSTTMGGTMITRANFVVAGSTFFDSDRVFFESVSFVQSELRVRTHEQLSANPLLEYLSWSVVDGLEELAIRYIKRIQKHCLI